MGGMSQSANVNVKYQAEGVPLAVRDRALVPSLRSVYAIMVDLYFPRGQAVIRWLVRPSHGPARQLSLLSPEKGDEHDSISIEEKDDSSIRWGMEAVQGSPWVRAKWKLGQV